MRGLPATNFSDAFRGALVEAARERSRGGADGGAVHRDDEMDVRARARGERVADGRVDVGRRELRRVELDLRAVDGQGQRLRERRLHRRGRGAGRHAADPDPCDPDSRGDCVTMGARRRGGRQDPRCDYTERGCERRSRTPVRSELHDEFSVARTRTAICGSSHTTASTPRRASASIRAGSLTVHAITAAPRDLAWRITAGVTSAWCRASASARVAESSCPTRTLTYGRIADHAGADERRRPGDRGDTVAVLRVGDGPCEAGRGAGKRAQRPDGCRGDDHAAREPVPLDRRSDLGLDADRLQVEMDPDRRASPGTRAHRRGVAAR